MDENAHVLDKDAESYPTGTIKAYGFKAGDGNYYAVDAVAIPDLLMWGGYNKLIESLPSIIYWQDAAEDYNGEHNTTEIIKALDGYNDGYATGAPVAETCQARIFNGKQGFLPAFGQFNDFRIHRPEVDILAAKFSLDAFETEFYYWTSTQRAKNLSWRLNWEGSTEGYSTRNSQYTVRAFFAL